MIFLSVYCTAIKKVAIRKTIVSQQNSKIIDRPKRAPKLSPEKRRDQLIDCAIEIYVTRALKAHADRILLLRLVFPFQLFMHISIHVRA